MGYVLGGISFDTHKKNNLTNTGTGVCSSYTVTSIVYKIVYMLQAQFITRYQI